MTRAGLDARRGNRLAAVDLGGTWVRVALTGPRPRAFRGPAPGPAGLPTLLAQLWRRWRLARRDLVALGVASRGVWTGAERRALARRLYRLAPRVVVISDVEAAYLAALGATPGVLLLAGTGSIALGRDRGGRWRRAGGLGPLLGDDGSAFSIGRAWLRTDSIPPARARRLATSPDAVARIAALVPSILRHARNGNRSATHIVRTAQQALADLVQSTARQAQLRTPIRVSWAGGLLNNPTFRAGIWKELRRRGTRITPVAPRARATSPSAWLSSLSRRGEPRS